MVDSPDKRSKSPGADPAPDLAPERIHLGGQGGDAALFAITKTPSAYRSLTDPEIEVLKMGVAGSLTPDKSETLAKLLKTNAAATELVLAEQLLASANRSITIPDHVSKRILAGARSKSALARKSGSFLSWRYVGLPAGVAAMLFIGLAVHNFTQPRTPNFMIASLDDRTILETPGGVVTRGLAPNGITAEPAAAPIYVLIDVRKGLLVGLFGKDRQSNYADDDQFLSRLSNAFHENGKVGFVFDQTIEAALDGNLDDNLRLRVYDLSSSENKSIASHLSMDGQLKQALENAKYYITPAP